MIEFALAVLATFAVAGPFVWVGWMSGKWIDRILDRRQ